MQLKGAQQLDDGGAEDEGEAARVAATNDEPAAEAAPHAEADTPCQRECANARNPCARSSSGAGNGTGLWQAIVGFEAS